jgi:hypothetical protein
VLQILYYIAPIKISLNMMNNESTSGEKQQNHHH